MAVFMANPHLTKPQPDSYTKLLLHCEGANGSTKFVDSSVSSNTVSVNGNVSMSTAVYKFKGSSAYFDGNGDYLSVADSDNWDMGSSDFSVDWWEYRTSSTNFAPVFCRDVSAVYQAFLIGYPVSGGNLVLCMSSNGSSWDVANEKTLGTVIYNTWTHYAVVRKSNNFYTFQNGVQKDTWTSSSSLFASSAAMSIGYWSYLGGYYPGYLQELRVSKGIARWTTDFTVPAESYPYTPPLYDYTKLLLHCNGANGSTTFGDSSSSNHTVTPNGDAQVSTSSPKFGSGCVTFDGTGDYLEITDNVTDFRWGTGDFTIEAWLNFTSVYNEERMFSSKGEGGGWFFDIYMKNTGTIYVRDVSSYTKQYSWSPSTSVWYHFQFVMASGTDYLFVDGMRITGSGSWSGNGFGGYNGLYIGVDYNGNNNYFNGKMDEIRVVKGVAANTRNFIVPSGPY